MIKNTTPKMNCAEAVAQAVQTAYHLSEEELAAAGLWASGKPPEGECASFYAARRFAAARNKSPKGSLKPPVQCQDVQKAGKLSCVRCAEILKRP